MLLVLDLAVLSITFLALKLAQAYRNSKDLAHVPGTWHSRFSSIGLTLSIIQLKKCAYIDDLFRRYGDVVRIGELSEFGDPRHWTLV